MVYVSVHVYVHIIWAGTHVSMFIGPEVNNTGTFLLLLSAVFH